MSKVYVIGGANIDIFANSINKIIPEDSNISNITFSFGGVARNIAENLHNLGIELYFISAFSNDTYGKSLYEDCKRIGFNLDYAKIVDDVPSSIYLAVMDNNHDMYVGCNDMRIIDYIDNDLIDSLSKVIHDDDYVVLDTNLNEELLVYAFSNLKGHKVMDAISANKAYKLSKVIDKVSIVKLNMIEAETIANRKLDNNDKIYEFLKELNSVGTEQVIVSTKSGMYVGYQNDVYHYEHDQYNKNVVNATGAGDALLAGYFYGEINGYDIEAKCCLGLANSILTVRSSSSVAKSTIADVTKQISEMIITGGKKS